MLKTLKLGERMSDYMKIAMFAPYIAAPGSRMPNCFEYWQKSASSNKTIDFYIPTNLDMSLYEKYDNIHIISLSAENFWEKLQALFDFPIIHDYYKTAEYRVFFGIIFHDLIKDYDYWGTTEFDMIYGNIMKLVQPYIDAGIEVIGRTAPFRLIKNTEKLCNLPFAEIKDFAHPLTLQKAFSSVFCWHYDEVGGMEIKYHQAGVTKVALDEVFAEPIAKSKSFVCIGKHGKWEFVWDKGSLWGCNDLGEKREFLAAHFMKRKLSTEYDRPLDNYFYIVPNHILQNCGENANDSAFLFSSFVYTVKYLVKTYRSMIREKSTITKEDREIWLETVRYCEDNGLLPVEPRNKSLMKKLYHAAKRIIVWR